MDGMSETLGSDKHQSIAMAIRDRKLQTFWALCGISLQTE